MVRKVLRQILRTSFGHRPQRSVRPGRRACLEMLESRMVLSSSTGIAPPAEEFTGWAPRIVNGTPTNEFPAVGIVGDASGGFCSGTLIGQRHVLTAGHCLEGLGNTQGRFTVGGQRYSASQIQVHPQYNDRSLDHDLAIMTLSQPVTNVAPSLINRTVPFIGQTLTLVGFGAGGTSSGHTNDFGTKRVGTTPIDSITPTLIRWNFDNPTESNTAPGDSGGPAFIQLGGVYYVAGVTSGGDRADAGLGDRSYDARVDAYTRWIDGITGQNPTPPTPVPPPSPPPTPAPPPSPPPVADDHVNQPGANATVVTIDTQGVGQGSGKLEQVGDRDVFRFQVTHAGPATIRATGVNGLDTYLRIYDASQRLVAENDDFGGSLNSQANVQMTVGTYYISVGSYADQFRGDYQVHVQVATQDAGPFAGAVPVNLDAAGRGRANGDIGQGQERDYFSFTVNVTGRMTVRSTALSGGLDTVLKLYDASGREIAMNDDYRGGTDSRIVHNVSAGQKLYAEVSGWGGTTGRYRLDLSTAAARAGRGWGDTADVDCQWDESSPDDLADAVQETSSGLDGSVDLDETELDHDEHDTDDGEYDPVLFDPAACFEDSDGEDFWSQTNWDEPWDVNDDGVLSPLDVLLIVNRLNATNSGFARAAVPDSNADAFWDVSGDGQVTPLDALLVINRLNKASRM